MRCITSLYHFYRQYQVSVLCTVCVCTWCYAISDIWNTNTPVANGCTIRISCRQWFFISLNLSNGRKTMKTFQCWWWWKLAGEHFKYGYRYCIACIKLIPIHWTLAAENLFELQQNITCIHVICEMAVELNVQANLTEDTGKIC